MTADSTSTIRPELDERTLVCRGSQARVMDVVYPAWTDFDTHDHEDAYLCLTVTGSYDEWIGGTRRRRRIDRGRPLVYTAGSRHAVRTGSGSVRIVHVTDPRGKDWDDGFGPLATGLLWQLSLAAREREHGEDAELLHIECLVQELGTREPADADSDWVGSLSSRLRDGHRERITLSELSRDVGRHPAHVARAFRTRWGMTAGELLRRFRVAAAIRQLTESEDPLSLVAFDCGFADQSHMGRWMRAYTGRTPGEVRGGPGPEA